MNLCKAKHSTMYFKILYAISSSFKKGIDVYTPTCNLHK